MTYWKMSRIERIIFDFVRFVFKETIFYCETCVENEKPMLVSSRQIKRDMSGIKLSLVSKNDLFLSAWRYFQGKANFPGFFVKKVSRETPR